MIDGRDPEVLSGQAMSDRYQFLAKLGSGGMAEVFLGVQRGEKSFRRLVVIKKIRKQFLGHAQAQQMFVDEARTAASLHHPHIVQIFDLSRHGPDLCIAMEYVDGESLAYLLKTLLRAQKRFPLDVVAKLMVDACDALEYAHTARTPEGEPLDLVHRDISPHNLMLDNNGYLKVIDFGIAKSSVQLEMTSPGMLKGKFSYLAPDRFKYKQTDRRSDIYALGLVFFELLTLRRAIDVVNHSFDQVVSKVLNEEIPAPSTIDSTIPAEIDAIVATATSRDRQQRYQTAEEMGNDLRSVMGRLGGLAPNTQVRAWYHEHFAERIAKRRQLEQQAATNERLMQDSASASVQSQPGHHAAAAEPFAPPAVRTIDISDVQLTPSTLAGELSSRSRGSVSGHSGLSLATDLGGSPSRFYAYSAAVLLLLVVVAGGMLYRQSVEEAAALRRVPPSVVVQENLFVMSIPVNADVMLNGEAIGTTGSLGLSRSVTPGRPHVLRILKEGYLPYEVEVVGEQFGVRNVVAKLTPRPAATAPIEPVLRTGPQTADTAPGSVIHPEPMVITAKAPTEAAAGTRGLAKPPSSRNASTRRSTQSPAPPTVPSTAGTRGTERAVSANSNRPSPSTPTATTHPNPPRPSSPIDPSAASAVTPDRGPSPTGPSAAPAVIPDRGPSPTGPSAAPATATPSVSAAPAVAQAAPVEESPTEPGAERPEPPAPKWLSGAGQWSGRRVVADGCGRCHNGSSAARLESQGWSGRRWKRFFRRGDRAHAGWGKLSALFSPQELGRAQRHVMSSLKEEDRRGIAGVR